MVAALSSAVDLAEEIGKSLRLARAAQGLRQEDLAVLSQASLQAIKNLEKGGNVELVTFLRVAKALGVSEGIVSSCQPTPQSLVEIERLNAAHQARSRVRRRVEHP